MAGYLKLWTTLLSNETYVSLPIAAKALYYHLLLRAKEQRDDGTVVTRSEHALSMELACDKRTLSKMLRILSQACMVTVAKLPNGALTITIPKYKYWQDIDIKSLRKKIGKRKQKCIPLNLDQLNLEQSRAIKTPIVPKGDDTQKRNLDKIPYQEIIDDLNIVLGLTGSKRYRVGEACKKDIRVRFGEGYTFEDFKIVHRSRAARWLNDPEMRQFLRPSTLYRASKFQGYLTDKLPGEALLDNLSPVGRQAVINANQLLNIKSPLEVTDESKSGNP